MTEITSALMFDVLLCCEKKQALPHVLMDREEKRNFWQQSLQLPNYIPLA